MRFIKSSRKVVIPLLKYMATSDARRLVLVLAVRIIAARGAHTGRSAWGLASHNCFAGNQPQCNRSFKTIYVPWQTPFVKVTVWHLAAKALKYACAAEHT